MSKIKKITKQCLIFGCVAKTFNDLICTFWFLEGSSMEPHFLNGQIVLSSPIYSISSAAAFSSAPNSSRTNLNRGDVVIVKNPREPQSRIIKRIKGLENDYVQKDELIRQVPPGQVLVGGR